MAARRSVAGLSELIGRVSARSWTDEEMADLRREVEAITSEIQKGSGHDGLDRSVTLTGYMLPGADWAGAFKAAAGLAAVPEDGPVWSGPLFLCQ